MADEYRQLTYSENGAWGLKGASLMSCPPKIYGAAAKLHDMESACERIAQATQRETALDELQELVDIGLGGRFVELAKMLEVEK